jgi:uncharacterized oxidoreductase
MKMSHNTILITGGTSGIGFELAAQLLDLDNTVIITGRDPKKLESAQKKLPKVHTIQSDVARPDAIVALTEKVARDFPDLNILINNAGIMRKISLLDSKSSLTDLTQEIETNLMGPIRMVKQFLPHLKAQRSAAIVNVSSGLAFVPLPISPIYCATKAGLHSYTQSLRIQLKKTAIKVFELAPPGTDTPLFHGDFTAEEIKAVRPMAVKVMVNHAIAGFKKDRFEIRPGLSNVLKTMSRIAPELILKQLGKSADHMAAQV